MENHSFKSSSAKVSIVGLFAVLTFAATLPIALLLSQEKQDLRGKAAEITPNPTTPSPNQFKPSSGIISGYVYYDDNKNGERDLGEKPYPGVTIKITQITNLYQNQEEQVTPITADTNGYFKFHFSNPGSAPISYQIQLVLPDGYKTIDTNPMILSDLSENMKQNIEFGLFPIAVPQAVKGFPKTSIKHL